MPVWQTINFVNVIPALPMWIDTSKEAVRNALNIEVIQTCTGSPKDFYFPDDLNYCICPAGKHLYRSGGNIVYKGLRSVRFKGPQSACVP